MRNSDLFVFDVLGIPKKLHLSILLATAFHKIVEGLEFVLVMELTHVIEVVRIFREL